MWYLVILNKVGSRAQKNSSIRQNCHRRLHYYVHFLISEYLSCDWQSALVHVNNKTVLFYTIVLFFSTFESIYLKYFNLYNPDKKLSLSYQTICHVFISKVGLYSSFFSVTYLSSTLFLIACGNLHLLWKRLVVGIYCRFITDWIKLTPARILFTAQYRTKFEILPGEVFQNGKE